ncbi:MAG: hypothetical protein ACFFCS_22890, partial [Candidatus Hodarchaeota archaeon]
MPKNGEKERFTIIEEQDKTILKDNRNLQKTAKIFLIFFVILLAPGLVLLIVGTPRLANLYDALAVLIVGFGYAL